MNPDKLIIKVRKSRQKVLSESESKLFLKKYQIPVIEEIVVSNKDEAVKAAYFLARDGETVLLSPACASFDLFESFEDRGRQFKDAVRRL